MSTGVICRFIASAGVWTAIGLSFSGCSLFGKRDDASNPSVASSAHAGVTAAVQISTNFTRASGAATHLRLKSLFPSQANSALSPANFALYGVQGANAALGAAERPAGTIAQYALRKISDQLCVPAVMNDPTSTVFASGPDILMGGETMPTDPVVALAFSAARRVWLYPYTATSDEVKALVSLYQTVQKQTTDAGGHTPDGLSATDAARQAVCQAVLISPQFWIGNPGPADAVRRAATEVGQRLPTFSEINDFLTGAVSMRDYVKKLEKEAGYLDAITYWHQDWLGLRPFLGWIGSGGTANGCYYGCDVRSRFVTNVATYHPSINTDLGGYGLGAANQFVQGLATMPNPSGQPIWFTTIPDGGQVTDAADEEACDPTKPQAFDPRTQVVRYEQWNPVSNRWETLGGWNRAAGGGWTQFGGSVTMEDGSQRVVQLSDATPHTSEGDCLGTGYSNPTMPERVSAWAAQVFAGKSYASQINPDQSFLSRDFIYSYFCPMHYVGPSALIGTPMEHYFTISGGYLRNQGMRRLVRITPDGVIQNGISLARGWYSGDSAPNMAVCNGFSRIIMSCAYRPKDASFGFADPGQLIQTVKAATPPFFDFLRFGNHTYMDGEGGHYIATLMNPPTLDNYACGPVSQSAVESLATSGGTLPDATLFPKGDNTSYTDLLSNIWSMGSFGSDPESRALQRLKQSLQNEPYYMIRYLVKNHGDYRDLVAGKYTLVNKELELLYRSMGLYLPTYPPGYHPATPSPTLLTDSYDGGVTNFSIYRLNKSDIMPLPKQLVTDSLGMSTPWAEYQTAIQRDGKLLPRPMSGLLTQTAFLTPVAPKVRSVASRIISRLMCSDPGSVFQPSQSNGQWAIHAAHVPGGTDPAVNPHLKPACVTCHINMDPLASALSTGFSNMTGPVEPLGGAGGGELFTQNSSAVANAGNWMWGIYGVATPASGAFLGQAVSGVEQVGSVLSQSHQFSQCVVTQAFQHIYGRAPNFTEASTVIAPAMAAFQAADYDFNTIVEELVSNPAYLRSN